MPKRSSDAKIEALMMPVPPEPRPSRCLRLSQPKTYSSIVDSMKKAKGCRDWKSFSCFPDDDIDNSTSAIVEAQKRRSMYAAKMRRMQASYSSDESSDMAGWQC